MFDRGDVKICWPLQKLLKYPFSCQNILLVPCQFIDKKLLFFSYYVHLRVFRKTKHCLMSEFTYFQHSTNYASNNLIVFIC